MVANKPDSGFRCHGKPACKRFICFKCAEKRLRFGAKAWVEVEPAMCRMYCTPECSTGTRKPATKHTAAKPKSAAKVSSVM